MNENAKISRFLEDLLDQYKNSKLTQDEERRITEFYMKERFMRKETHENDENDPFTYLVLGWYIYEFFLKKNNN